MIAVILGLAVLVADESARWPRGDEWYLVGADYRLARVHSLPKPGQDTFAVVGADGKPQELNKFSFDRYVLLDGEPDLSELLVCGREVPGAISSAAGAADAVRWGARFGEVVAPVKGQTGGFDGRSRKVGGETFVLVWKWERDVRQRSVGWVREGAIARVPAAPRADRPFEDELTPGRAVPIFYPFGLPPTASLERLDAGAKGVRVPTKAVLKRNRSATDPDFFRVVCYTAPAGAAIRDPLRVLQHYHVYSATETDGPTGRDRWYLIGADDFVAVRRPQDGPTGTLLGWVRGENVVLWGTAQALEFDPVTRPQRTFPSPDGKRVIGLGEIHPTFEALRARYAEGKNPRPVAVEIPERFQNHLARMPILEQRTLLVKGQSYTAYKVAYVAHNLVLPEAARQELNDLRTRLDEVSNLDLLFVVDATANSGVHRAALRTAVRAAWDQVEQQNRRAEDEAARGMFPFRLRVRVGILAYREPSDREWELEAFDFTGDKAAFDNWWSDDKTKRRLEFTGGFGDEAHASSVRKALGVAFATAADGKADVAVPGPKPRSKTLKFSWAPGGQRVVVVLGDVGQKDTTEPRDKTDKLFEAWKGLKHKPFLVGVQVGTPDWFAFPNKDTRDAAVRGYERFGEDFRVLAEQVNATDPGRRPAAFYHLTRPGDADRQKELAETFDRVWAGTALARAQEAHAGLSGAWGKKVREIAAQLGVAPTELTAAVLKPGEPLIRYDEGWVIERNPFPDAPGFNVKQVCPCVLIDDAELRLVQGMLLIVADKLARARKEAQEVGAEAVGKLLEKNLAQLNKPVREQLGELSARHPALHFIEGLLRYTPQQFEQLEVSQIVQWEAPINLSIKSIKEYLDDKEQWAPAGGRQLSWMPVTILPDEGGQFPLTRAEVEQLRDGVLRPLHGAFLEVRSAGGREKVAPRLERWARSPDGQKGAEVMKNPRMIPARVGLLAMSPAQLGGLSEEDVVLWHRAVFRALRDCDAILRDRNVWVPYKGAETTWYPVALLPNPFRIRTPDVRDLDAELAQYGRDRKPKEK